MIGILITAVGCCLGVGAEGSQPSEASYETLKARVGRDAGAQVRLALWCEAHGLEQERLRHLAIAVLTDPSNTMARGLMGLVEYQGKWTKPEKVAEAMKVDVAHADLLAEYNGRRVKTAVTAVAQYKLALWCEEKGLHDEARAHLATVVRLDPRHADAWKKLGFKRVGNRWMTDSQVVAEKTEREAQQQADKDWRPRLEKLRDLLGNKQKRVEAERTLAEVSDPRAVASVWRVFVEKGDIHQILAVQLLGQIDAIEASRGLATLAVFAKNVEVRKRATETLKRRDPREYADRLIALLKPKIKYEVRPVGGPGSPGVLRVEGKEVNVNRVYAPPPPPNILMDPTDTIETDLFGLPVLVKHRIQTRTNSYTEIPSGADPLAIANRVPAQTPASSLTGPAFANNPYLRFLVPGTGQQNQLTAADLARFRAQNGNRNPNRIDESQDFDERTEIPVGRMMVESNRAAVVAQSQLQSDVAQLDSWNKSITELNERVGNVLNSATAANLPAESKPWLSWWGNQLGVAYKSTPDPEAPTIYESVPLAYVPQPVAIQAESVAIGGPTRTFSRHSCFGKGTLVRTVSGPRAIETLSVGDLILTQNAATGKLGYQPVLVVFHNPPSPTFKVSFDDTSIITSPSHRFWKAGRGWVMARDLKLGDPIRTIGGVAKVTAIEPEKVQPVFNLDVADDADFFAGSVAALVHDNTLPDLKQTPFDRPTVATVAK